MNKDFLPRTEDALRATYGLPTANEDDIRRIFAHRMNDLEQLNFEMVFALDEILKELLLAHNPTTLLNIISPELTLTLNILKKVHTHIYNSEYEKGN